MRIWVWRMTNLSKIRANLHRVLVGLVFAVVTGAVVQADETVGIDATEKSLMFAGRCMAQVFLGAPPDIDKLNEMPENDAMGHLFGSPGSVYFGVNDRYVMVVHKPTHCGVNAFDETAEDMKQFFAFWLEREDSPFTLTESRIDDNGNALVFYDGHCTECGFDVHARGYWFRQEQFTIYRLFATKPEGAS